MTFEEWFEEYEEFVEEKAFLKEDDGDPDLYRAGYRAGYSDALQYVFDWILEDCPEFAGT